MPQREFKDPRAARIYRRLLQLGAGPAAFFADAYALMKEDLGLSSRSHVVGHLLRGLESSLRAVLAAATGAPAKASHAQTTRHILSTLGLPTDGIVAEGWLEQVDSLLGSWRSLPGQDGSPLDPEALDGWVRGVLGASEGVVSRRAVEFEIGQVLARSSRGEDGVWTHEAVRSLIERLESDTLEDSIRNGRFNGRGVTTRMPFDGGDQERILVAQLEADAQAIAPRHIRTATMLRRLADTYRRLARREDTSAELLEDLED